MSHMCIKTLKPSNEVTLNKHFRHWYILKGLKYKSKMINGYDMVTTAFGNQVCRVNSSLYQTHFKKV